MATRDGRDIEPLTETIDPEAFDPMLVPRAQEILAGLREFCLSLPETSEGRQSGDPAIQGGKKTTHRPSSIY